MPRQLFTDEYWNKFKAIMLSLGIYDKTRAPANGRRYLLSPASRLPLAHYTIADKGYDSELLRIQIREKGSVPIIPRKQNSTIGNDGMDWCLYKYRHLVENVFARLKHFRAIATRYDKLKRNYESVIALACAFIWLPM